MDTFKKITGVSFLLFGILGALICLSYTFDWDWFDRESYIFGRAFDGDSASNTPALFGLIAIAGALLLWQVKTEAKDERKDPEIKESNK